MRRTGDRNECMLELCIDEMHRRSAERSVF
jgi:hypothetical protein